MAADTPNFLSPDTVIIGFYNLLNEKKYPEAFDCLTPDFKERVWKNDLNDFAKGYTYTLSISNVSLALLAQDDNKAEVGVTYDDTMEAMHHPLIDDLVGIQAEEKNSEKTQQKIAQFKKLMVEELSSDPKETQDIVDDRFFEPNNVEVCLWLGKADYIENNTELFQRFPETHSVYRRAICINTPKGWLIEGLKRS